MAENKFGGAWTLIKLEIVERYLSFYTTALKNICHKYNWKLLYIDAFAGTGQCYIQGKEAPVDGSAIRALNIKDPFDEYHFIENDPKFAEQLKKYTKEHSVDNIHIHCDDANSKVVNVINGINWKKSRAVMFLDPFGMEVGWELLQKIANTQAIDLWYLFPLSGLYRNAPRKYAAIDSGKEKNVDFILGTPDWRDAFYEADIQQSLLDDEPELVRTKEWKDLIRYVKEERLESIFHSVLEPKILPDTGSPRFALFFAVANPKAASLASKVADHILTKN